jgi:adenylate kinase
MLGPPGAGKGTQGARLASAWGVPHVSSGDLLRRALADDDGSEVARAARAIADGSMVSDEVASAIVFRELEKPEATGGFVLDGYPRNERQAGILDTFLGGRGESLQAVLALRIDEEALVARLMGRLTCPNCGESYHLTASPPKVAGICDRCGTELTVREDDQPEAIHRRLELYAERTAPLFDYYGRAGLLREVDATGDEETVFRRCVTAASVGNGAGSRSDCLV